jgi:hypothetical protein
MTPTSHGGPAGPTTDFSASRTDSVAPSDAPTSTIPVYSPAFPEASGPALAGHGGAATGGQAGPAGAATGGSAGSGTAAAGRATRRGPRRAQLQLRHINPWTVLKFTCVLSIALFFVWLIMVGVLYGVLDAAGVIDKINNALSTINGGPSPVRASVVFGGAAIIGVVNMILFIALSTVGSVVYNLCADLVGGIEITLSES